MARIHAAAKSCVEGVRCVDMFILDPYYTVNGALSPPPPYISPFSLLVTETVRKRFVEKFNNQDNYKTVVTTPVLHFSCTSAHLYRTKVHTYKHNFSHSLRFTAVL